MSTPTQQARAVIEAEAFLHEMADPGNTRARIVAFRVQRARAILRHLPTPAEWSNVLTPVAPDADWRRLGMRDEFMRESVRQPATAPRRRKR